MGTHQGQSEGRVSEGENVSKDLCNGYHGKEHRGEAGLGWTSLNKFSSLGA